MSAQKCLLLGVRGVRDAYMVTMRMVELLKVMRMIELLKIMRVVAMRSVAAVVVIRESLAIERRFECRPYILIGMPVADFMVMARLIALPLAIQSLKVRVLKFTDIDTVAFGWCNRTGGGHGCQEDDQYLGTHFCVFLFLFFSVW